MKTYHNTNIPRNAIMYDYTTKEGAKASSYGICTGGYFASGAWLESDESFRQISGRSFGWFDWEDQSNYCSDKSQIRKPTQEEWERAPQEYKAACIDRMLVK